jgi:Ca-activated chloride channel family protein
MNNRYNIALFLLLAAGLEVLFWVPGLFVLDFMSDRNDFRLEHPDMAWWFFFIPVLILAFTLRMVSWNRRSLRFADARLQPALLERPSLTGESLRYVALRAGLGLLLVAMINPQYGVGEREGETESVEIMVALDISNSMLAKDKGSSRDRLSTAKVAIGQFLKELRGDRVGLVVFAGNAVLQLPLTADYDAARLFLNTVTTETVSSQGTNIAAALEKSLVSMDMENGVKKAIILISDGENHEEDAVSLAAQAAEAGIIIHTIGIGSPNGVPVPELDAMGNRIGNLRDENDETVLSKLNEDLLQEIAATTGGSYTHANGYNLGLGPVLDEIKSMERTASGETVKYTDYNDQFQWFLAAGLLFLIGYYPIMQMGLTHRV